jgi:hypothetical protein
LRERLQVRLPVGLADAPNDALTPVEIASWFAVLAIPLADALAVLALLASSSKSPTARLLLSTGVGEAAADLPDEEAAEMMPLADVPAAVTDLAAPTGVGAAKEDEAADKEGIEAVVVSSGTSTSPSLSRASERISILRDWIYETSKPTPGIRPGTWRCL